MVYDHLIDSPVSGKTGIRNQIKNDKWIYTALQSALALCDLLEITKSLNHSFNVFDTSLFTYVEPSLKKMSVGYRKVQI